MAKLALALLAATLPAASAQDVELRLTGIDVHASPTPPRVRGTGKPGTPYQLA